MTPGSESMSGSGSCQADNHHLHATVPSPTIRSMEWVALMFVHNGPESTYRMGSARPTDPYSHLQNQDKENKYGQDLSSTKHQQNETDEAEKDDFYDRLLRITQEPTATKHFRLQVMGALHAKIGGDNTVRFEEIMRTARFTERQWREILANLCATSSLVIGGSLFQHKRIYKATWVSPDHLTENQIDQVSVSKSSLGEASMMFKGQTRSGHYEKAFDSVDTEKASGGCLRLYGVPEKTTNSIRNSYEGMTIVELSMETRLQTRSRSKWLGKDQRQELRQQTRQNASRARDPSETIGMEFGTRPETRLQARAGLSGTHKERGGGKS
ncbi:hypothetical protein RRG08_010732 [Elysia crispata]|uniref:Uncharacterized protein n=1 Tax=Elysia crispata TaxID=231223 RepID=A0AAE1BB21_9GAST|nr:hypothetical protein RRG08_010732 [Elysia crispata]